MADEAAVIDATPITDTGAANVDSSTHSGIDDNHGNQDDGQGGIDGSTDGSQDGLEGAGEYDSASTLWKDVKTATAAGQPLTKQQMNAVRKAIHASESYEKNLPGGLESVKSTLEALKQLSDDPTVPVEKVIQEAAQERAYFRELDQLFTNGDSGFIEKLADVSPESFQSLAPAMFSKFAKLNPEGYSAYVSQAVVSHMNQSEVPLQFRILQAFLPQLPDGPAKDQVIDAVNGIYSWKQKLEGLASKPVTAKPSEKSNIGQTKAEGGDDLQMREMRITAKEWNAETLHDGINLVNTLAAQSAGKQKLSSPELKKVLSKVAEELDARLSANREYGTTMQGYLRNGNKTAYNQRVASERKRLAPGAVSRAVADVLAERPKTSPNGQQPVKAQTNANNGQVKTQPGSTSATFVRIAGHPKTLGMKVDMARTTHSMLLKKQAFVKGEQQPRQW